VLGLEGLDEETLRSLSIDAPVRLTPSPESDNLIAESSPTPPSKIRLSNEVMEATLEQLGFGPPNDLSDLPISPTPMPPNSETSTTRTFGHEEKVPKAKDLFQLWRLVLITRMSMVRSSNFSSKSLRRLGTRSAV
jgi:hypothetical protein